MNIISLLNVLSLCNFMNIVLFQTGLSGNIIMLSVLYSGGMMMTGAQISVGDLTSFLLYAGFVGISFGGNKKSICVVPETSIPPPPTFSVDGSGNFRQGGQRPR